MTSLSHKRVPAPLPLMQRPRVQRVAYPLIVGLVLLVLWQGLVTGLELPPYLVPSPALMVKTLITDWAALGLALWVTVKITVLAFVTATVVGVLISFLFVQSKGIETALFPYAVLLQVTPIVAVAPLIIIWVKDTMLALTVCATIIALFPVIANTTLGLRSVNPGLMSYFKLNRATRLQTLVRLRIPSAPGNGRGVGAQSLRLARRRGPPRGGDPRHERHRQMGGR